MKKSDLDVGLNKLIGADCGCDNTADVPACTHILTAKTQEDRFCSWVDFHRAEHIILLDPICHKYKHM